MAKRCLATPSSPRAAVTLRTSPAWKLAAGSVAASITAREALSNALCTAGEYMTTMLSHRPAHYDYTVPYMDKPTHHDVDVILKLYDLRREDRMRKARSWLFGYKASNAAEHQAACPPGSDQEAYYRMVTSYWDMAASFVTSGAVNKDLFLQNAGELLFVWEKAKGTIADTRKAMGNPKYLSNLETVAQALIENMSKGDPKAYEMFSARVKGMGA